MSEPTHEQIVAALHSASAITLAPGPRLEAEPHGALPLPPSTVWDLPGGTAWVYYGEGNKGLVRPVIFADGFNTGPSSLDFSWEIMEFGDYALISELRRRGHDVILLGFHERSASILDNSVTAQAAITQAIMERQGDPPLAVGGFSMGGLVTRHALAKMESQSIDHQTALYFSYDSPHRGAWIPIALQAFGHYIRDLDSRFSDQINSPAARQLLWRHIAKWDGTPDRSDERAAFLAEMAALGEWPRRPRLIGVANGVADGTGTDVRAGELALEGKGLSVVGTKIYTQPPGDDELIAKLRVVTLKTNEVHTSGLPSIDGAPGGSLEGFGILADVFNALNPILGFKTDVRIRSHCFVPAVSAVDIRGLDTDEELYADISSLPEEESGLDEFKLASRNEGHTLVTEELSTWLLDRLP
ncbi:alpha/beta hydrolase [Streptomyces sp. NBC_01321]|uniref:esterase/lipase family protein n=1 Tax=unclassified Streptomyces TaxID=2593676 RepID=UPI002E148005|nr:alpha/beta hydrolase [Streptomyces sp. NBC_01321]WSP56612.1 alpha/beta hydrolase [Streptomyces sp. NBC_01241]